MRDNKPEILIAPSPEFIDLCQSQITLLHQSLQVSGSAVYLTIHESYHSETEFINPPQAKLIPIVVYPHSSEWELHNNSLTSLPEFWQQIDSKTPLVSPINSTFPISKNELDYQNEYSLIRQLQVVFPLIYDDMVMGLLVTSRQNGVWQNHELHQIENVAKTIAIARLLEQRQLIYEQQLSTEQHLRKIERERLDNFLHQLRNPLTALRTFAKLLLKRIVTNDPNQKITNNLLRESDRLQELIQDFDQDIDRIEPRNLILAPSKTVLSLPLPKTVERSASNFLLGSSFNLEKLAIKNILEPLLESAQAIAKGKNIEINYNIPDNIPLVRGNSKALIEICNNLIDNALKYTPSKGKIDISVREKQTPNLMLGIVIGDTGYGIPIKDQAHIFERHYRGVQAEGDIKGTGIGLAIVKELCDKMKAQIEVISPNHLSLSPDLPGTTFIVWLPQEVGDKRSNISEKSNNDQVV